MWLEAELDHEEQAGWLNGLMVEQGMTLYQVSRQTERLEDWFMDAVAGLSHRGEGMRTILAMTWKEMLRKK